MRGDATREARALLEQALAIDPGYAPAWSALGYLNAVDISQHLTGEWPRARISEALAQVRRAIELGSEAPEAYIALAMAQRVAYAFTPALAAAQHAVELGPPAIPIAGTRCPIANCAAASSKRRWRAASAAWSSRPCPRA